ncbi:conserved hypothetical protein [Hyphomicrobiales bacterium]|nr:conserved hypothetical protein [Hyphomicrobiales bacterium]CAH1698727.1 conserved hypothetical protein [Hyphomicrobiales bacterium]CAI0342375.1 conserved hypothetical protein [Hyphomicrobiales bacterium]
MPPRSTKSERYDLIVFESFEYKGQKRHKAHRVGSGTSSPKGGFVLYIPTGIAITGRVMVVPEKTPLNEIDLLEAYQSAADEYRA